MNFILKSLFLLVLVVTGTIADEPAKAPANKPAAKPAPRAELLPIQDVAGLPRVLLEGKANVHRVLRNCGSSQLGAEKWAVEHFNFGAYDLLVGKDGAPAVSPQDAK